MDPVDRGPRDWVSMESDIVDFDVADFDRMDLDPVDLDVVDWVPNFILRMWTLWL